VKFAIKLQESVHSSDVSEDGWEQLAVKVFWLTLIFYI
jgi:hypothetical protein